MVTRSASRLRDQPPPPKPTLHDDDSDDEEDDEDDEDEEDEVDDELATDSAREQDASGVDSDSSITGSTADVETGVERRLGVVSISVAALVFSIVLFALFAVAYNVRSLAKKGW